ncbi:MAG TPA: MFS transporter [Thermoleophilaceae bacterium]|nr:MFS transporter [Thermoleophilaceae bacterium]
MSRGRGVVAGCALGATSGWNFGNLGGIASELADAYGVGLAAIGLLTTAMVMTHLAIQIPGGTASDRFGPARAGALALVVMSAGNVLALAGPDAGLAVAARAIVGVGTGLAFISGSALVRESGGGPFAQGVFGGVSLAPGGLALAVVPQLEDALGWRAPYWSALALALVVLVAVLVLAPAAAEPERPAGARPAGVVRDRRLWRVATLYSASYGLGLVLANWVVELLQRHSSLSDGAAAAVGALTLVLVVVSRPLGGWILLSYPRRTRVVVGASLVAGPAGTLALVAADPAWLAVLGALVVGLGAGIPFSPAFTGAAATRRDAPAAAVGFVNTAANLVVLVGTPLLGLGFSLPSDGRLGFALIALLWAGALALLPSPSALGVRAAAPP